MKTFISILGLVWILLFQGCSTANSVTKMEGEGTRSIYDASYDKVWAAAVASARTGDLYILIADKEKGTISAKRGMTPTTFGENVSIWVRSVSPTKTQVEVVSRQGGPPVFTITNWEKTLLDSIAAHLAT